MSHVHTSSDCVCDPLHSSLRVSAPDLSYLIRLEDTRRACGRMSDRRVNIGPLPKKELSNWLLSGNEAKFFARDLSGRFENKGDDQFSRSYLFQTMSVVVQCGNAVSIMETFGNQTSYWQKKDVVGPTPTPFVGTFGPVFLRKKTPAQLIRELYNKYQKEKYFGIYQGTRPALVLRDIESIKQVMIKDFGQFQDRGFKISDSEADQHLFALEGDTWRVLRHRLTPIFTSGMLKTMIPLVLKSVDKLL
ncbi:Cytochrome P450 6B2 [Eumeta japonica]|uniref:unspecific monooxygenase n=1 Tax=Eumeta variegata TaxID=151549 RepID=A0A4C1X1N6_EUMVA|nr:Cytochrome P450 6B2 [Eumeta japonica]